jgi:hypothetical protein
MNLVACEAPTGALDAAPQTALRQDSSTERWTGFWGTDDRYYARCTTTAGQVAWFCFDPPVAPAEIPEPVAPAKDQVGSSNQPEPVTLSMLSVERTGDRRRTLLYRVGRSASHGCIFGVRRPLTRATALRA